MEYNFTRREVYMPEKHFRKDRYIELTPNENKIFSLLWLKKDGSATYREICKVVYGDENITEYDRINIRRLIHRIRKKGIHIVSLYKYGYKLKGGN